MSFDWIRIEAAIVRDTEREVLLYVDGRDVWVRKSQLEEEYDPGYMGMIHITQAEAKEKGLL